MKFTDAQNDAASTLDQNLQIIACAGSGKTQVVSQRIVNLMKEQGIGPGNIVAFTYTEKAAAELKHRVLTLAKKQLGDTTGFAELYIGTIHSWCLHYLKENIWGYQKYEVLNDIRLKLFIDQRNRKIGMADLNMKRYVQTNIFIQLMGIVREEKPAPGQKYPKDILDAVEKYENELDSHAFFDFTMILTRFLGELEKNETMRSIIARDLKYLIVDEYQDVNYIQETIIREICNLGSKICVVGDDDQTIYQWRGSNIDNILAFADNYNEVKQVTLADNFRSSPGIIDLATKLVSSISINNRLPKQMHSTNQQTYEEGDMLLEEFLNESEEEQFIVKTIKGLRGKAFKNKPEEELRGLDYSDMCILLRKWRTATRIVDALKKESIPFIVTGVAELFEQPEISACYGIYRCIAGEVSPNDLKKSWHLLAPDIDLKKLGNAVEYISKIQPDNEVWHEYFNLQQIYIDFREKAGITESLFQGTSEQGLSKAEVVFYNMGMFSQIIEDFEVIHFKNKQSDKLKNFLNFLHYTANGYYPEGWLNNNLVTPNAVTITTVHQAKGLEYPVVFIPNMNKNYFPSKKQGGLSVWHFLKKELIQDQARFEGTVEDEMRLLYVAVTRSMKYLFISRAPSEDNRLYKRPSDFLKDIRKSNYIFSAPGNNFLSRLEAPIQPNRTISNILLNFSLLESFYECPYQFKYYTLYGFKEALSPRIGYGKSIHDTLMELHKRAMNGDVPAREEIESMLDNHLHFPYAIQKTKDQMREKAVSAVDDYYSKYHDTFNEIEYAEKDIQLDLGDGILVNGRMDLIKRRDLDGQEKTYIIDFKSEYEPGTHDMGMKQLLLYALGYKELTGHNADFLQIYDFAEGQERNKKLINDDLDVAKEEIRIAADKIRSNHLDETCGNPKCPCRFK